MAWTFELNPVDISSLFTKGAAWNSVDLSTVVPAGTKAVALYVNGYSGAGPNFRPTGATSNRLEATGGKYALYIAPLDANRCCEAYIVHTSAIIRLVAYTNSGTWSTGNYPDKSATAFAEWQDVNCSAELGAEINFGFFEMENTYSSNRYNYFNGVSNNLSQNAQMVDTIFSGFDPLNASRITQQYCQSTQENLYLIGGDTITKPSVGNVRTINHGASWVDLDLSDEIPTGVSGIFFEICSTNISSTTYAGVRQKGSSSTITFTLFHHNRHFGICGVGSDRTIQTYGTEHQFRIVGWFIGGVEITPDAAVLEIVQLDIQINLNVPMSCTNLLLSPLDVLIIISTKRKFPVINSQRALQTQLLKRKFPIVI